MSQFLSLFMWVNWRGVKGNINYVKVLEWVRVKTLFKSPNPLTYFVAFWHFLAAVGGFLYLPRRCQSTCFGKSDSSVSSPFSISFQDYYKTLITLSIVPFIWFAWMRNVLNISVWSVRVEIFAASVLKQALNKPQGNEWERVWNSFHKFVSKPLDNSHALEVTL